MKQIASIVIPTYERPDALKRQILFLSRHVNFNQYRVLVADGSRESYNANKTLCKETNIEYIHDPDLYFVDRWIEAIKQVDTDFVMLLADDDLINPDGLYQCISFLQNHSEYSCAMGSYFTFQIHKGDETALNYHHDYWWQKTIDSTLPLQRLKDFLSGYFPIQYAVHRRENLLEAYQTLMTTFPNQSKYLEFMELLPACLSILKGKFKFLPVSYMGRERGQSSQISSVSRTTLEDFVLHPLFWPTYQAFRKVLTKKDTQRELTETEAQINTAIDKAYASYLLAFGGSLAITVFNTLTKTPLTKKTLADGEIFKQCYNTALNQNNIEKTHPVLSNFLNEYVLTRESSHE